MLTISDGDRTFTVNKTKSIELELHLNKSTYGREWLKLGDSLYEYGSSIGETGDKYLYVTCEQYDFLHNL